MGLSIFLSIWVLRDPTFPAKKTKKRSLKARQGHIKHVCKISASISQNDVDVWTFVRYSAKITVWHRNYLILVYIRSWGAKYDLVLVLRKQFFEYFRETLYKHMPWSTWKRLVQKKMRFFFFLW